MRIMKGSADNGIGERREKWIHLTGAGMALVSCVCLHDKLKSIVRQKRFLSLLPDNDDDDSTVCFKM